MDALQKMRAQIRSERKVQWEDAGERQCGSGESTQMQPQALFGYALARNLRGDEMGDFHVAEIREIDGKEVGLFGVFDSHGGSQVGREVQHRLFDNILGEGGLRADPAGATRDGYLLTDRQLLESHSFPPNGGSTAVTAILVEHGSRLIVANVGDSRSVISKNGVATQVSVDHDPGRLTERANIERRGGVVLTLHGSGQSTSAQAYPSISIQGVNHIAMITNNLITTPPPRFSNFANYRDVPRVDGQVALARAFGDKALKEHMSAKPDVFDLLVDLSCEFLILASNGLWSTVSNEEAVALVKEIEDPCEAAKNLVLLARQRLTEQDISCIVIRFREQ